MKADLPKRNLRSLNSIQLNDCWNKIGVWGNRECGELKKVIHCRNCIVYSSAAGQLLGAEPLPDYLEHWATYFASEPEVESRQMQAALIFRIGAEWLALSPMNLQEIAESRPTHSLPPGRSNILLGLANIDGELLVCVALDRLLGLEIMNLEKLGSKQVIYRRLVVASREGSRVVFPVDEVHGIHRFNPNELKAVPSTISREKTTYIRGMLLWQNESVSCLDDQLLFDMLDRSMT
jgi:chemotaxis-related protein WspD